MANEIKEILKELQHIKDYLTKLGPSRRSSSIREKKRAEAKYLYDKFCLLSNTIVNQVESKEIKSSYSQNICVKFDTINSIYSKILQLCSENIDMYQSTTTMEKFELRTAVSLLPVMTGDENVTKQLISNIEMYESMIDDDSKKLLIQFVLKSRLSESAKLRMCSNYLSVTDLIKDMRDVLLPKKSDTAIQSQLQCIRQDNTSIQEFGKQIEKLFVDLTVSQANGNSSSYEILKPINERIAIKRFADGLRNSRLSTIIAARNYSSLKDAIQGALDENLSSGREERVMNFYHNRGRSSFYNTFGNRNPPAGFHKNGSRGYSRGMPTPRNLNNRGRGCSFSNRGNIRNFDSRGQNNYHGTSGSRGQTWVRSQARRNQINLAEMNIRDDSNQKSEVQDNSNKDNNWFFRA